MKTTVKQLAAGTFLALLLVLGNTNVKGTEVNKLTPAIETKISIENWMIDESMWNKTSFMTFDIVQEAETALELEYWMTSETNWNLTESIIEESETELLVEDWMVSDNIWNME